MSKHDVIINRLSYFAGHKRDERGNVVDKYDRKAFKKGEDLAKELCDSVNGMSRNVIAAGFLEGILRSHRFLQSEAIFCLMQALGDFGALEEHVTDPRNEAAHEACGKVREALRDVLFWRD